ncbi:COX15/CtaA family protein [Kineococcus rhizosphaerae]|uniref:Cytochrome c oxidase assembly protein subunit 15 n=1 Tax=Kineococcus rhizosphaerae TaxID=559628 RepID=A0A2T0R8I8_9ACTN|nr:COX15/CtaA family protein [Kineococcus rhizosphaerae]PRY17462.1 cytochrome c oxidase assembly protein subunit 15 [Kineococcus rhizosphaerae]
MTHSRAVRWTTTAALAVSILIIVTGGVVRVTGSGLGCPDWPRCTDDSFTSATATTGIHGAIEFGNRMLTTVICVAVGAVIIACLLQRPRHRALLWSAWGQFAGVVLNAVVGGITVWTGLNPYVVAAHFLAAIALLISTTVSYDIAHRAVVPAPAERTRRLARALVAVTAVVVVVGTVVTGSGPHPGDSAEVHRIPVSWTVVTVVHGIAAVGALLLAAVVVVSAKRSGDDLVGRRAKILLVLFVAQAALGVYQSLDGLPGLAVVLHLGGAAVTAAGATRVLLAARTSTVDRTSEAALAV